MGETGPSLRCHACGWEAPADQPLAFRCGARREGDDTDHLLVASPGPGSDAGVEDDPNPFLAHRRQAYSHGLALAHGMSDDEYVALVRQLDARLPEHGFRRTPLVHSTELGIWAKDESGNVAGSHKARHLFGLALLFAVAEDRGLLDRGEQTLAIASCGNAALAAAVVASSLNRPLRVFLPSWAEPGIVQRLNQLGAEMVVCERTADSPPGDPCFHAFQAAVRNGAVPFTCQGSENGLTIDGGMTLGFELSEQLDEAQVRLDRLFLQVGGGALASSTCEALRRKRPGGEGMPAIHAVQTRACQPLVRAWRRLANDLRMALPGGEQTHLQEDRRLAGWILRHLDAGVAERVFQSALRNRSRYMQPIPHPAHSIADGILDDETYDWFKPCRAMIETGGWPVVVAEDDLRWARRAASVLGERPVSATGAAGLAGVRAARRRGDLGRDDQIGVLLTGVDRRTS